MRCRRPETLGPGWRSAGCLESLRLVLASAHISSSEALQLESKWTCSLAEPLRTLQIAAAWMSLRRVTRKPGMSKVVQGERPPSEPEVCGAAELTGGRGRSPSEAR